MKREHVAVKMTGIWLDQETAYIVSISDTNEPIMEKIHSDVESRIRYPGGEKPFTQFGITYSNEEAKKQRRQQQQKDHYFKKLIDIIHNADYIYLFGPSEAKEGLKNAIERNHELHERIVRIESADQLTENQIIARVKEYFSSEEFRTQKRQLKERKRKVSAMNRQ